MSHEEPQPDEAKAMFKRRRAFMVVGIAVMVLGGLSYPYLPEEARWAFLASVGAAWLWVLIVAMQAADEKKPRAAITPPPLPREVPAAPAGRVPRGDADGGHLPAGGAARIPALQAILAKEGSWVLFAWGTVVILAEPEEDLSAQAIRFLQTHGPVIPGTPSGDVSANPLKKYLAYVVTYDRPEMLTIVPVEAPMERIVAIPNIGQVMAFNGRQFRVNDSNDLEIIHVEDKRPPTAATPPVN